MSIVIEIARKIRTRFPLFSFPGSREYWVQRYAKGGNSGAGSYGQQAEFKAKVINHFVQKEDITTVIEFGCGDGHQLSLARYSKYIGFDISAEAISLCRARFADDDSKRFRLMNEYEGEKAELTLSLDVIYHLVEDDVFEEYMERLFSSSSQFVVIYSSNVDDQSLLQLPHVRHREFTKWINQNIEDWQLIERVPPISASVQPFTGVSRAEFFVFGRISQ